MEKKKDRQENVELLCIRNVVIGTRQDVTQEEKKIFF
jgi:hypothetical protein